MTAPEIKVTHCIVGVIGQNMVHYADTTFFPMKVCEDVYV